MMRTTIGSLLLILLAAALSCSDSTSQPEVSTVRYDGVYQAESSSDYSYFLRFYADSTVVHVSSTGTPGQVAEWFGKGNHTGEGEFVISGNQISFMTRSVFAVIEWEGTIHSATHLQLNSLSHENGHRATRDFHFVAVELGATAP
jgi:hypothetical protein